MALQSWCPGQMCTSTAAFMNGEGMHEIIVIADLKAVRRPTRFVGDMGKGGEPHNS